MSDHSKTYKTVWGNKGGGGKGGGGGSSRAAQEDPNTLVTKNIVRILGLVAAGSQGGLVDGLKSVYLDGTPVVAADGTENFKGVTVHERLGSPDQDIIPGFSEVEEEQDVSVQVKKDIPIVRTFDDPDIDAVRVKIGFPSLLSQDQKTGDLHGTSVAFTVESRPLNGDWSVVHDVSITDKNTAPAELDYRVQKPEGVASSWDIRVVRITPDSTKAALKNDIHWNSLTKITESKLFYPYTALLSFEADAEQFGERRPQISEDWLGSNEIKTPSNRNPVSREYSGPIWDGSFQVGWTDNPAWVLYHVLENKLDGVGRWISPAALSMLKWDLYEIGKYCDELVPDGYGGMEPRFTANGVIAKQEDARQVLNSIVSIFRGMIYWGGGGIKVSADQPRNYKRIVTRANIKGRFERPGTRARDIMTSVVVGWNNMDEGAKLTPEVVEDPVAVRRYGHRVGQLSAFMCSSRGQARRFGKWALAVQELEPVIFTGTEDLQDVELGEVVRIYDPEEVGASDAGRLKSATLNSVVLDRSVVLEEGHEYGVVIRNPGEDCHESDVIFTGSGSADTLTLATPLTELPADNAVWAFYDKELVLELARVLTKTEKGPNEYQFECMTYLPGLHDKVDRDIGFAPPKTSLIPTGPMPLCQDLSLTEFQYQTGPTVGGGVYFSFRPGKDIRQTGYEIHTKRPGEGWKAHPVIKGPPFELQNVAEGDYEFRVRPVDGLLNRGPWAMVSKKLFGLADIPEAVTGLSIEKVGGLVVFRWNQHPALDVRIGGTIEIRHSSTSGGLPRSISISDPLPGGSVQAVLPLLEGSYLIIAKDIGGRASVPVEIAADAATVLNYSTVGEVQADPIWLGEKVGIASSSDYIHLSGSRVFDEIGVFDDAGVFDAVGGLLAEGFYTMAAGLDFGTVGPRKLITDVAVEAVNIRDRFDERLGAFDEWLSFDGEITDESDCTVEIKITNDDPNGTPVWSDWVPLTAGEVNCRAAWPRLRITTNNPNQDLRVSRFRVRGEEVA